MAARMATPSLPPCAYRPARRSSSARRRTSWASGGSLEKHRSMDSWLVIGLLHEPGLVIGLLHEPGQPFGSRRATRVSRERPCACHACRSNPACPAQVPAVRCGGRGPRQDGLRPHLLHRLPAGGSSAWKERRNGNGMVMIWYWYGNGMAVCGWDSLGWAVGSRLLIVATSSH
jgi:hypothetical protein